MADKRELRRRPPLVEAPRIDGRRWVFVCGLHGSGTSVLHRLLRASPEVAGFAGTGVPEDEGQHLQSVFPTARAFGGPGRFAFAPAAAMTEAAAVDPAADRDRLLREWAPYLDLDRRLLVEKSPPNLVRSRYLQALFPGARFLFLLRHPVAAAMATQKFAPRATRAELLLHWHVAHEIMRRDLPALTHRLVVRYEDLVGDFDATFARVRGFLGLADYAPAEAIDDRNAGYLAAWAAAPEADVPVLARTMLNPGQPAAAFGYRLDAPWCVPAPDLEARR